MRVQQPDAAMDMHQTAPMQDAHAVSVAMERGDGGEVALVKRRHSAGHAASGGGKLYQSASSDSEPKLGHATTTADTSLGAADCHDPTLAGPPRPGRRQALLQSWLVVAMVAFIIIICVASGRLMEGHPGEGWHSLSGDMPFAQSLVGDITYVQAEIVLPPWEAEETGAGGVLLEQPLQGNRRSLQSLTSRSSAPSRLRNLLAGAPSSSSSHPPPPTLDAYLAQQLDLASGNTTWTMLTWAKSCTFAPTKSQGCLIEFREVPRINTSLPAAVLVTLMPTAADQDPVQVAAYIHVTQMGGFGLIKEWIALIVIVLVLIALATEAIDRMWIAFIGGFLMTALLLLANLTPDLPKVMGWIDSGTMALLFGMMLIVGQLQKTGVFEVVCAWGLRRSKGNLLWLTILLCVITAFVSAWLDNVTTMLLMAPMTISVFKVLGRDPCPLLITQAMLSNVGGTATMVGDPPNIIIGNVLRNEIGFVDFLIHLAPGVLFAIPATIAVLIAFYRKTLTGKVDNLESVLELTGQYKIKDWKLFWMCTYVTLGVILAFLLQPIHHLNPGWVALIGGTILLVAASPHDAGGPLHAVEWEMLLFFAGMFIMVEGAVELGLMRRIASFIAMIIESAPVAAQEIAAIECIIWFSAIFSAVLDNIPYTIAMLPVIEQLAAESPQLDLTILAWALAFGACLGGNGTLIGASANIVTAAVAQREGHHIGFMQWLYAGVPTMLVSVAFANAYMLMRYCT